MILKEILLDSEITDQKTIKEVHNLLSQIYLELDECIFNKNFIELFKQGSNWEIDIYRNESDKIVGLIIYKEDYRTHCGKVIIVDSLISIQKGLGTKLLKELSTRFPEHPIQLDCAIENEDAYKFYIKSNFKPRATSFVRPPE